MLQQTNTSNTLKEYGRGIVGGLIFSIPLVYTMEVWFTGFNASPEYLISCIVFTFLLLLGYNRFAGMRKDTCFADLCWDSVEEIGLAFIISFIFLFLISQITFDMSLTEIVGKVVVESMIVAIGISVGTAQLGQNGDDTGMEESHAESKTNHLMKLVILSICGATLFAAAVAPTDEIVTIAVESEPLHLLLMVIASVLLCAMTLFFSHFKGGNSPRSRRFEIISNVVISYTAALFVSFMLLLFFGRVDGTSVQIVVAEVIVLGMPAAIGASAGRLLIAPNEKGKNRS